MRDFLLVAGTVFGIGAAAVMVWLWKLRGMTACRTRDGLHLDQFPDCWQVSPPSDPEAFVRALPRILPPGSTLCLEATSIADDVRAFLESRQASQIQEIRSGTIWPRSAMFHIPATPDNIEGLAQLFRNHATPEICDHFHG